MIYTEQEAKEKRCPQKAVECSRRNGDYVDSSRTVWVEFGKCEGIGCLAWRWFDDRPREERRGFCGMAGTPRGADHA